MHRRTHKHRRRRKTRGGHAIGRIIKPTTSALARQAVRSATTRRNIYAKPTMQFAKHIKVPNVNVNSVVKNTSHFLGNVAYKIPKSFAKSPYVKEFALMPGEEEEMEEEFGIRY
jgi:hypothetical protein